MSSENEPDAAVEQPQYSPTYRGYVLVMLVLGYIFNTIDRGIFGVVAQPIKEEFGFSDAQLGIIGGLAFAFFYSFVGIFLARIADSWHRVRLLSICIGLWSISTALCGAAIGFFTLLAARASTAVGEAGGTPPSHSLISDFFPIQSRGTALAIYAMAVPIGVSLSNLLSGHLNVAFGWRQTFMLLGLPGLAIALLIWLTVKEPPRGYSEAPAQRRQHYATPPMLDVFKFLCTRRSFVHMGLAAALHSVVWYAGSTWNASFFIRSHGMDTAGAGSWLSLFALIGALGTLSGGILADRLSNSRDDRRWYMWVPGIACMVMVPFQFLAYLHPSLTVVVPSFIVMVVLAAMFFGPSFAVAQSLATVRMRGVSTSLLLFMQTLIGLGIGPSLAGTFSDLMMPSLQDESLRYAMVIVGLANIWASIHYFLGARSFRDDLAMTARLNQGKDD